MHNMLIQLIIVNINVSQSSGFRAIERLCSAVWGCLCASLSRPKHTDVHRLRAAPPPQPVTSQQLWAEPSDTEGLMERGVTSISPVRIEKISFYSSYFCANVGCYILFLCPGEGRRSDQSSYEYTLTACT